MKVSRIVDSMGYIDEELISGAIDNKKKNQRWSGLKWVTLVAGFVLMLMAGIKIISVIKDRNTSHVMNENVVVIDGIKRRYEGSVISSGESGREWAWEDKTIAERYTTIQFGEKEYLTTGRQVGLEFLGEVIGICKAEGYDIYGDKRYTQNFEVREIKGVSEKYRVAVAMGNEFYVYMYDGKNIPETLGELLDTYSLEQMLELDKYTIYESYNSKGFYKIKEEKGVWKLLTRCRDAKVVSNSDLWSREGKKYLSFTATSEALGIYKKTFCITDDGYVATNIFNYSYVYDIGENAAKEIIAYAKSNSVKTESEPYEYTLGGTVAEITDTYILIDDSVLCVDENDGMLFKVYTDDLRIARCLKYGNIKVGDTVVVTFSGKIDEYADNMLEGAYSIVKGEVIDGNMLIWE